jgi:hypothetical protein
LIGATAPAESAERETEQKAKWEAEREKEREKERSGSSSGAGSETGSTAEEATRHHHRSDQHGAGEDGVKSQQREEQRSGHGSGFGSGGTVLNICSLLVVHGQLTLHRALAAVHTAKDGALLALITLVIWATCAGGQPTWWVARLRTSFSRVLLQ